MPPANARPDRSLRGRRVLVTTGPTREHLDPIRFMTNASSGRMGYSLAAEALRRGARVSVVHGPTAQRPPKGTRATAVVSALDMRREVLRRVSQADIVIGAAAVGDWRFARTSRGKIKRGPGALTVRLLPNPDILAEIGAMRKAGKLPRLAALAGFALETSTVLAHARAKLSKKRLDLIVANKPATLGSDRILFSLVTAKAAQPFALSKERAAGIILDAVETFLHD